MNSSTIIKTLREGYQAAVQAGDLLSVESALISNLFIQESRIQQFVQSDLDQKLYLSFLKNLINRRFDVSYPEDPASYDKYLADCIRLKDLMREAGNFTDEEYIEYTSLLLENLKTPYYQTYSHVLFDLRHSFQSSDLFAATLKSFYGLIIKSDPESLLCIQRIAKEGDVYRTYTASGILTEQLMSQIFLWNLSTFAQSKGVWLSEVSKQMYGSPCDFDKIQVKDLLEDFLKLEEAYLTKRQSPVSSLTDYLADRAFFLADCQRENKESDHPSFPTAKRYQPSVDSEFLNKYAYDMTGRHYTTNPAIDREEELNDLELILISPKKSPILIGEAGVGKTSVVEGLAYLLQKGQVPNLLKDRKIYKLTTTSLLSGTKYVGEMEERMQGLMAELTKHPEVILFIDEIHTIVGAGSTASSNNDISNMLKPYIDRGDIKIIGATTRNEYDQYIVRDTALARRFYPILVEEPDHDMVYDILVGTIPSIEQETKVRSSFDTPEMKAILERFIALSAAENQLEDHVTRMPELPLTLLEMAYSYAALDSRDDLSLEDCINSVRHSNQLKKDIRRKAAQYFK